MGDLLQVRKRGRNGGGEGEERWELPSMLLGRGRRRMPRLRNRIRIGFAGRQHLDGCAGEGGLTESL
jgi:hypothetical protein